MRTLFILALFSTACSPGPQLKAIKAAKASVESTITTTSSGTVDADQQAVLGFSVTGRVMRIHVRLGDTVKRGQILAEIENSDLQTIYHQASDDLGRAQELFKDGLVSKVALDDAKKNLDVARVNLDRSVIRAPFDGVITEQNLQIGELTAHDTTSSAKAPMRIVDQKPRIVKGDIDEIDLARVHVGSPARIKILAARPTPFLATVSRVVPYVSTTKEQDRTSQIELQITEAESAIPVGASADVEVITERKDDVLAVPARAVLGTGDQRYVYRFNDGRIEKTSIKTGVGNYDRRQIIEGLSEGDVVVYPSDTVELKDKLKVKTEILPWP